MPARAARDTFPIVAVLFMLFFVVAYVEVRKAEVDMQVIEMQHEIDVLQQLAFPEVAP